MILAIYNLLEKINILFQPHVIVKLDIISETFKKFIHTLDYYLNYLNSSNNILSPGVGISLKGLGAVASPRVRPGNVAD